MGEPFSHYTLIITQTPLRISLGGGGTDLPNYYRSHGHGFLIAAAITKYVYLAVNENFDGDTFVRYIKNERVSVADEVQHPLLRECLRVSGVRRGVEVTSVADVPAGTGLGSSGAFAVGLLKALMHYQHITMSAMALANEAVRIELEVLQEPIGKQDQFIAAFGGITGFTFKSDESVEVERLNLSREVRQQMEENLLLFYTGTRRSASEALKSEAIGNFSQDSLNTNLSDTRAIGYETRDLLLSGDLAGFGQILTRQWKLKFDRQQTDFHLAVNSWIQAGIEAGAYGGKLVGAGGGGFLLFYADRKKDLRAAMSGLGLHELTFGIDYEGTRLAVAR